VAPFAPDLVAHYHRIGGTLSPDWWHYIVRISQVSLMFNFDCTFSLLVHDTSEILKIMSAAKKRFVFMVI